MHPHAVRPYLCPRPRPRPRPRLPHSAPASWRSRKSSLILARRAAPTSTTVPATDIAPAATNLATSNAPRCGSPSPPPSVESAKCRNIPEKALVSNPSCPAFLYKFPLTSKSSHVLNTKCGSLEVGEDRRRRVTMETLNNLGQQAAAAAAGKGDADGPGSLPGATTGGGGGSAGNGGGGAQQRLAVLSYEQVRRLNDVMDEVVSIHGRGNFPTLEVRLRDLVTVVRAKLEAETTSGGAGMRVRDIRLNGGAASHVLATESQPYNDLDLIFAVELSGGRDFDRVKAAVLGSLFDLLPEGVSRKRITTCSLKEAYVSKMVKVNNDGDRWSLISLGNSRGHKNVELKFVDSMRRQFEFSVDSFQIVLDSLLLFYECSELPIGENFYPTVVGESVYGDFQEALYHLHKKLIATRHPEEIRGGGLLKYCYLLVKNYRPARPDYIKTLERYMCSRFFIDFSDIQQQRGKLENYLWNHFMDPDEEALKYQYLMLLHSVVEESTVCLMGHERRQTLDLIKELAYTVLYQEQQRLLTQPAALLYANGYYYAPVIPYPCTCAAWMACSS